MSYLRRIFLMLHTVCNNLKNSKQKLRFETRWRSYGVELRIWVFILSKRPTLLQNFLADISEETFLIWSLSLRLFKVEEFQIIKVRKYVLHHTQRVKKTLKPQLSKFCQTDPSSVEKENTIVPFWPFVTKSLPISRQVRTLSHSKSKSYFRLKEMRLERFFQ